MRFLWFGKPKKKIRAVLPKKPKKNLPELLKEYNAVRLTISLENAGKTSLSDFGLEWLSKVENQIINCLPDDFQKSVFRILVRYKFDITDFLKENWRDLFKEVCREICHFLYYGSPYPLKPEWQPLPFSGEEFFFWLLSQTKNNAESDRVTNILSACKAAIEKREIQGHKFTDLEIQSIVGRLLVIFAGEFARQSKVLIDVLCEIEAGEEFIKELLNLK